MDVALLEHLIRCRREPSRSSYDYLHLADLRDALAQVLDGAEGRWLDFGTLVSPYAILIPNAKVETADFVSDAPPDYRPTYEFSPGFPVPAPSGHFDGVLSTQVLEHVSQPHDYLRETWRLLRPGGQLVLSTHGVWEDHPSPGDYHRWTAQGLREQIAAAGFDVARVLPVTCGFRGLTTLALTHLRPYVWNPASFAFRARSWGLARLASVANTIAEVAFGDDRLGRESDVASSSRFYLALVAVATKGGSAAPPEADAAERDASSGRD